MPIPIVLGDRESLVLDTRLLVSQADLCFPLQLTRREVRNAVRRDAIPTVRAGRRKVAELGALCAWLHSRGDLLAVEYLRGYAEGRHDLPRTAGLDERPPRLCDRQDLILIPRPVSGAKSVAEPQVRFCASEVQKPP